MSFKQFTTIIFLIFLFLILPKIAYAEKFDLIAPSGVLQRGQQTSFTINLDTQGKKITSTQIGLTYDTQYLQFVNVTPGSSFSVITATPLESGKLLISGTETAGFSGQGVFAYVNFKLIATAPGSTELCTLWAPSPTPTNAPTPTALPKTGGAESVKYVSILGTLLAVAALGMIIFSKITGKV